jgi:hypothetical protein
MVLLPPLPECWDYRNILLCLVVTLFELVLILRGSQLRVCLESQSSHLNNIGNVKTVRTLGDEPSAFCIMKWT